MLKTVDQIVVEEGYEPVSKLTWSVGLAAAARWRSTRNSNPAKEMRPKTDPNPTVSADHTKCVYPDDFHPVIREIISSHDPAKSPQDDLFT